MTPHGAVRGGAGGRRPARAASFMAVLAGLALSGCAGVFGSHDLAPNGLPREEESLRRMLRTGHAADAYEEVTGEDSSAPDDEVLRLLYAGTAAYYAGRYEEGGRLLDLAYGMTEDRVTRSISREALSFLTNDRALPWEPSRTERLMLHVYAALTFLRAGEPDEAAVEARRLSALLDVRAEEAGDTARRRFFRYLAGVLFEAAREYNDAAVAYRLAGRLAPDADLEAVPRDSADVVVLVERGFVPHRVEQSVMVGLPGSMVESLTDGDVGERLAAAGLVAARLVTIANYRGYRTWYWDDDYRHGLRFDPWGADCEAVRGRCDDDDDENPYLLRIAWPVYRSIAPVPSGAAQLEDRTAAERLRLDVAEAVVRDFRDQRAELVARTVARAATKLAVTKTVEREVGERDEVMGQILGILTNIGTLVTERADTRTWHLLPAALELVRARVPAGPQELVLDVDGRTVELEVDASPGGVHLLGHRVWP